MRQLLDGGGSSSATPLSVPPAPASQKQASSGGCLSGQTATEYGCATVSAAMAAGINGCQWGEVATEYG
jgi:hypothetical protein